MGYVGNKADSNYSSIDKQIITGNGGTGYTLSHSVANANEIEVFVNNVRQDPGVAYTVNNAALTMTGAVANTDSFYVVFIGKAVQTKVPPDGSVSAAKLASGIAISASTGTFSGGITATAGTFNGTGGQVTTDNSGHITSKQSLDVATAGGRFIGKSNRGELGQIAIEQTANSTDGGYIRFATSASGSTSPTDRMRIDGTGNVGIGLTSPQELLHLKDGDIAVGNGTASNNAVIGRIGFSTDSSNSRFIGVESFRGSDAANADLRFHTYGGDGNKGERMRITNAGKMGFGTSTQILNGGGALASFTFGGAQGVFISTVSQSGGECMGFVHQGSSVVGTIAINNSSTSYNTSSDYRLKENVDYTWDATTRLKQLKPARFNFISDTDTTVEGFLAHEAHEVVPNSVTGTKDAMKEEVLYVEDDELPDGKNVGDVKQAAGPDYQHIDHSKLVPLLVKTIQELEARITALEA